MNPPNNGPKGLLLIDKPAGPTTYDLIRWIKRKTGPLKLGHAGTLDPAATGLVLVLLGREATRKQAEFMGKDKTYFCEVALGVRTATGDLEGEVLERSAVPSFSESQTKEALETFKGEREQKPPMYSAVKHKGKPLYKYARQGIEIERKTKIITIHSMEYLSQTSETVTFRTRVSSGTYIRVLAEELGQALGVPAALKRLRRETVGDFSVEDALPGEQLKELSSQDILKRVTPLVSYA